MEINDGFQTVQSGEETGPLKEIDLAEDGEGCAITFLAENRKDSGDVETAKIHLTWDDLERFVRMLRQKLDRHQSA